MSKREGKGEKNWERKPENTEREKNTARYRERVNGGKIQSVLNDVAAFLGNGVANGGSV